MKAMKESLKGSNSSQPKKAKNEDKDKNEYVPLNDVQKKRFDGTTVKKDKDGYFCMTHRCRSKSYPSVDKIPAGRIKFIESTGSRTMQNILAEKDIK